jgi:hypothetical protein
MNVKDVFWKRSGLFLTGLGFILVLWIGIINYWTGPVFSSLAFYLVPVQFDFLMVADLITLSSTTATTASASASAAAARPSTSRATTSMST